MKRKLFLLPVLGLLQLFAQTSQAQTWQALGNGFTATAYTLATDPTNNILYAGGAFARTGTDYCNHTAQWDGTNWAIMGMQMGSDHSMIGTNDTVQSMAMYNGNLYAGGHFTTAEGSKSYHIAKWDGSSWSRVGDSINGDVHALAVYNGELYASGEFTYVDGMSVNHIAKWNGTTWSAVGVGLDDDAEALIVYNGKLIAGGDFFKSGSDSVNNIAQWDGTSWTGLGTGMSTSVGMVTMGMPSMVHSLAVYNGNLYAGGMFLYAGGQSATNLAQWNGTTWSGIGSVGVNMNDEVDAITAFNGKLYIGGIFSKINSLTLDNIASWDGTNWTAVDNGIMGPVYALAVYNNDLIAAGAFTTAGSNAVSNIARYGFPLSIDNITSSNNNSTQLYPNPVINNTATIQLSNDITVSDYHLVLQDVLGRQVSSIPFTSMNKVQKGTYQFTINKNLPQGIYTYHIMDQHSMQATGKLVIE